MDHVILTDSELAMDEDALALQATGSLHVFGSFAGQFPSWAEFMAARTEAETRLNARTEFWQRTLLVPAFAVREYDMPGGDPLTIYAHLVDAYEAGERERASGAGEVEVRAFRRRVEDAMKRGWLWGTFYSKVEPEGEMGCVHRSQLDHVVSPYEWDVARAEGWPS